MSYAEAVQTFIDNATWLTPEDEPMVFGLQALAEELDNEFRAATYAQYGLTYRFLVKRSQGTAEDKDELEALLDRDE